MRILTTFLFFASLLFILACETDATMPPEDVARKWQALVDNNQFEEAKEYSTERTVQVLDMLAELFSGEYAETAIIHTDFAEMNCREEGDEAVCIYTLIEEGELYTDSFLLVRKENNWLVDMPEDLVLEPSDLLDDLFQELEPEEEIQ